MFTIEFLQVAILIGGVVFVAYNLIKHIEEENKNKMRKVYLYNFQSNGHKRNN